MITKMNYIVENYALEHAHPHEQCGYVISVKHFMTVEENEFIIGTGEVIDLFTPQREDYL